MSPGTKEILTAVLAATGAAVATGLITAYFTRQETIKSVAEGKTPLPPNATPTTSSKDPIVATPKTDAPPQSPPTAVTPTSSSLTPEAQNMVELSEIAQAMPMLQFGESFWNM